MDIVAWVSVSLTDTVESNNDPHYKVDEIILMILYMMETEMY